MTINERQKEIIGLLHQKGSVSVSELSKTLFVTEMTIRRDLSELEKGGFLRRYRGGAVLKINLGEMPISERMLLDKDEKEALALMCLEYLRDDMTVFIDSSSTCQYLLPHLSQLKKLNPELTEIIKPGQKILISEAKSFLRVQTTKTEYKEVEIPYDTVTINTSKLYSGDKKVLTKGVNGVERITELVTYIGGERVSSREVSRVTIKEAITEKIQVGTKKNQNTSSSSGASKGKLRWPAIGATSISSPYGKRNLGDGWHGGIDIVRPGGSSGCTVVAAEAGVVTYAGWYNSGGYTVMIDHGNGLSTMYCHMQNTLKVRSGQRVSRGQAIGNIGATGYVTGPHLHFEVKVNGRNVNPALYL
jgi:murein DD-endopeptidase MepM/ murein hydrolase activator NlpD